MKMFLLRIIILKNGFIKNQTTVCNIRCSIQGLFLQTIYIVRSIVLSNFFKSSKPPNYLTHYHTDMLFLFLTTQSYTT